MTEPVYNPTKLFTSALSFMKTGPAVEWACPHLEQIAENKVPFTDYSAFEKAFLACFAPVNAAQEVSTKLHALKQGQHQFARHIAVFEDLACMAGLGPNDKFQWLISSLHDEYKSHILE